MVEESGGSSAPDVLSVNMLNVSYGASHILHDVNLRVREGTVAVLLGRNGAGKTTLIETIIGFTRATSGDIYFSGGKIGGLKSHEIASLGIALVPQGRRVFGSLTVEENLRIAMRGVSSGRWNLSAVFELLPRLKERRGNHGNELSGGEQQMLAIGRALLRNPRLLLLDEPSEGLAGRVVEELADLLEVLSDEGMSVLLVEQNLALGIKLADWVYFMVNGSIAHEATPEECRNDRRLVSSLLGVSGTLE